MPYFTTSWFPRPWHPQYTTFYAKYNARLTNISTNTCASTFQDYHASYHDPHSTSLAHELLSICYQHEQCMLDALPSNILVNFNSASVVLGLMPTLLSTIGPSVAEVSLLSVHRPVLAFLTSVGAPAVWPTRLLEYNDPVRVLFGSDARDSLLAYHIGARWKWAAYILSILQYALATGAVINVFMTSLDVGRKSILSWGCTTTFGPLLWSTLAFIVHVVAAVSFYFAQRCVVKQHADIPSAGSRIPDGGLSLWRRLEKFLQLLWRQVVKEMTLCAEQVKTEYDVDAHVPPLAVLGNVLAGVAGFLQMVFGIIIFSSLQFVSVWDVLNNVLWRYVLSTIVCRLILVVEISGLRRETDAQRSK
jgi:hypothetical protein